MVSKIRYHLPMVSASEYDKQWGMSMISISAGYRYERRSGLISKRREPCSIKVSRYYPFSSSMKSQSIVPMMKLPILYLVSMHRYSISLSRSVTLFDILEYSLNPIYEHKKKEKGKVITHLSLLSLRNN